MIKTLDDETMTQEPTAAKDEKPVPRRVKMLVRRHLRLIAKGKSCFDQANTALALAINCGLQVGQSIELEIPNPQTGAIDKIPFQLINNFLQDVVYKPARVAHYEFRPIPKSKRAKEPAPESTQSETA